MKAALLMLILILPSCSDKRFVDRTNRPDSSGSSASATEGDKQPGSDNLNPPGYQNAEAPVPITGVKLADLGNLAAPNCSLSDQGRLLCRMQVTVAVGVVQAANGIRTGHGYRWQVAGRTVTADAPTGIELITQLPAGVEKFRVVVGLRENANGATVERAVEGDKLRFTGSVFPANSWNGIAIDGAPTATQGHTAVWTGSKVIIWGGTAYGGPPSNIGGVYNPSENSWSLTNASGAPAHRSGYSAVWDGSKMIIWGGAETGSSSAVNTGVAYDPADDSWSVLAASNAPPSARTDHTAIWTGSKMIIWGGNLPEGNGNSAPLNTGGIYDPALGSWTATATEGAPSERWDHTALWTGTKMIIWGGAQGENIGGIYDPALGSWTPISEVGWSGISSQSSMAVWTGSKMIVWGRRAYSSNGNNGGWQYDPATKVWTTISLVDAPAERFGFTAVWTGFQMIVWGGSGAADFNDGGLYDPVLDVWTPTATSQAPIGRNHHSAVWTGSGMIVWGGYDHNISNRFKDGGVYTP